MGPDYAHEAPNKTREDDTTIVQIQHVSIQPGAIFSERKLSGEDKENIWIVCHFLYLLVKHW